MDHRDSEKRRQLVRVAAAVGGAIFAALGIWAFLSPGSFFEAVAHWPPYSPHLIRDSGAFQIGIGAMLLLASWRPSDGLTAVLAGGALAALLHVAAHAIDHPSGGRPLLDFPSLGALAILLIIAAAVSARSPRPDERGDPTKST